MPHAEARVVRELKHHLLTHGLRESRVLHLLVDAHPSYVRSPFARDLEPMTRLTLEGTRPDILCSVARPEGVLVTGIEVKASERDWVQGLGQAHSYRPGVHHAYLALPSSAADLRAPTLAQAKSIGVGILARDAKHWVEVIPPADPSPLPRAVSQASSLLEGVPAARSLQLNHPLNYLAAAFLADRGAPSGELLKSLAAHWKDLGSDSSRRHAAMGANTLGLLDLDWNPTLEGRTVADLLAALQFDPDTRYDKRKRLLDVNAAFAAVARFVLIRQPAVRLIHRTLTDHGGSLTLLELAVAAGHDDPALATALFLADPSATLKPGLRGPDINPSTVFKLKQNLWHAGLLDTKAHGTAGKDARAYRPAEDLWALPRDKAT
ncbi:MULTISPECIES: hypothetical protein [unclassified Corallococcus]|uniref:hypothetical protein n=1 Tax=unclassified Corallococcus TaxID=2685029 RepID=UPI001A8DDFE3|nr:MULTISPECIES: hypothetical protein [unclassified Corallococcus]MBN9681079.1 hypothetical protein [Corallococcus sp. NCSPR001]WAS87327.1 hypothetical protein O0N60_10190 [Corallococcus sp. NCRR]